MNKPRFSTITIILSILMMSIMAGASFAQTATQTPAQGATPPGPGGPRGHFGPGGPGGPGGLLGPGAVYALDLTEAQLQQIKTLRQQSFQSIKPILEQLRPLRQQMQTLIQNANFDENAATTLVTQQAQLTAQIELINARTEAAIYNLLTPDQKAKLAQRRQRHGGAAPTQPSSSSSTTSN